MWLNPRPPERGQCEGRKNLKQRRSLGVGQSVPGGSLRESAASVGGWVLRRGYSISGASFCICGWGERSEPRPHIQRLARGLRRGGDVKEERI